MPKTSLSTNTEDLLRETRRLKEQVLSFKRSATGVMRPLNKIVSAAEIEAMVTPRANALGTLENLHYQDLGDLLRQLTELEGDLRSDSLREGETSPEP
jgi:hypothetical protein